MGENLQTYCIKNGLEHLLKEWHPVKNGDLRPTDVTAGSNKKVYWLLPYDDSKTGKHYEFEWQAVIQSRVQGRCCPYLSGKAVWKGFNDLETINPEIAAEWHPTKNGDLKPADVTAGSNKKVYWKCPIGHTYKMLICNRSKNHQSCPICQKEKQTSFPEQTIYYYIKQNFPDTVNRDTEILLGTELDIYIPSINTAIEYDGSRWHQDVKRDINKNILCNKKKILLYRIREEECPNMEEDKYLKIIRCTENNMDSLSEAICEIGRLFGVKFDVDIERDQMAIYSQYINGIKENSLAAKCPEIAKEWNYIKNGDLTPEMVNYRSNKSVWWVLSYDDPKSMMHFNLEWKARIYDRINGVGCPYLSGHKVLQGFNDLCTTHPKLAKEWHPIKNGNLKPSDVTAGSHKRVWWLLQYYDSIRGKYFNFEWQTSVKSRVNGNGCPYLSGHKVLQGFNDLCTTHPKLAKEWHPIKNGNLKPDDVTSKSTKKVWWYLPYDDPKTDKHFNFEWEAIIENRVKGNKCPFLSGRSAWHGFNDLSTIFPEIAAEWHPKKNGKLKPDDVMPGSNKKVWWMNSDGKEWKASIYGRTKNVANN